MPLGPKDPLAGVGPEAEKLLFEGVSRLCNGASASVVLNVAANLIVNSLRQSHGTRARAAASFDEVLGRTKAILMAHYDSNGRKKGIFPFDQVVVMPLFRDEEKWR